MNWLRRWFWHNSSGPHSAEPRRLAADDPDYLAMNQMLVQQMLVWQQTDVITANSVYCSPTGDCSCDVGSGIDCS